MTTSTAELKKQIIELLKTDEEFRYTVAGLIGLREILDELRKLREQFNKLWLKSLEHDKRFEEVVKRLEVLEKKMLEHDKRFEEINKRFEAIERKLLEHDRRFEVIERKLLEHDKRFEAIERKLLEHDKRFEAIEKKLLEHDKRFEVIERKLLEHDKRFEEINRRLSRIELELGVLNEAFYCKALWDDLKEEIVLRGEKLVFRKRNARVDDEDIDYLIVTDRAVYVVEVKVKPKHEDVGRLLAKVDVVRKHYRDKNVVAILAGAIIGREVEEYAVQKGVKVYNY